MVAAPDGSTLKILDTTDRTVANPYVAGSGDLDGDGRRTPSRASRMTTGRSSFSRTASTPMTRG